MDKRVLLNQLKEARETKNEELFLELMNYIHSEGVDDPDLIIEVNDAVLDIMEEWGWLDRMIEYASGLVKEDPSNAQSKAELGYYYYRKGWLDKAEIILASSLELTENPLSRYYLDKIRKSRSETKGA